MSRTFIHCLIPAMNFSLKICRKTRLCPVNYDAKNNLFIVTRVKSTARKTLTNLAHVGIVVYLIFLIYSSGKAAILHEKAAVLAVFWLSFTS